MEVFLNIIHPYVMKISRFIRAMKLYAMNYMISFYLHLIFILLKRLHSMKILDWYEL